MKKLAVVFGVAAVATLTGCRDQDYDARRGKQVQDEPKVIETAPAKPVAKPVAAAPVKTQEIVPVEVRCTCPPGTKHASPCGCGASDCACIVERKPVVVKPAEPEYTVYIVQNGDFLSKISKKYNVTIGSIKRLNNMKSDSVRVGQKLKLPGKIDVGVQSAPVSAAPKASGKATGKKGFTPYTGATKEYVVKNGDTLGSVAYGNGLNIRQLKQLNNLTSDSLKIGQKLKIPADKETAKMQTAAAKAAKKSAEPKSVDAAPAAAAVGGAAAQPEAAPAAAVTGATTAAQPETAPAAQPEAAPAETKPAAPATTTYVVQEGEDLTRIAVDFGVTTSVIRELNNLGENDTVKPGQVLKLPAEAQQ